MSTEKQKINHQDLRVLQKNMVYCSGLPSNLTQDQLKSGAYFGQYGKIEKIVVNPFPNRNYCSVYLTYSHEFEAATAILACNQFQISRSTLWCLFGTMKYCRFFLKKIQCKNIPNCPYLHTFDHKNEIQIQNSPSEAFPEHERLAKEVIRSNPVLVKQLKMRKTTPGQLPDPIYAIEYVEEEDMEIQNKNRQNSNNNQNNQLRHHHTHHCQDNREEEMLEDDQNFGQNGESSQQEQQTPSSIVQQEQQEQLDLEKYLRKTILKQLERSKCSKLISQIQKQENKVKETIVAQLMM